MGQTARRALVINRWGSLVDTVDHSRPPRPCACCGVEFQPSRRRRLLCRFCFLGARGHRVYSVRLPGKA